MQRLTEDVAKNWETLVSYRSLLEESVVRDEVRCNYRMSYIRDRARKGLTEDECGLILK